MSFQDIKLVCLFLWPYCWWIIRLRFILEFLSFIRIVEDTQQLIFKSNFQKLFNHHFLPCTLALLDMLNRCIELWLLHLLILKYDQNRYWVMALCFHKHLNWTGLFVNKFKWQDLDHSFQTEGNQNSCLGNEDCFMQVFWNDNSYLKFRLCWPLYFVIWSHLKFLQIMHLSLYKQNLSYKLLGKYFSFNIKLMR